MLVVNCFTFVLELILVFETASLICILSSFIDSRTVQEKIKRANYQTFVFVFNCWVLGLVMIYFSPWNTAFHSL